MNPVITIVNKFKTYQLEKKDLAKLRRVKLMQGEGDINDIVCHQMCIMQAVSMITTEHEIDPQQVQRDAEADECYWDDAEWRSYNDHPICVSEVITDYLIEVNDSCSDDERKKLIGVVPDILNTCPVEIRHFKTQPDREVRGWDREYSAAETERRKILHRETSADSDDISITAKIAAVRKAANLYRTAPGKV